MRRRIVPQTETPKGPAGPSDLTPGANGPQGQVETLVQLQMESFNALFEAQKTEDQSHSDTSAQLSSSGETPLLIRGVDRIVKSIFDDRDLGDEYQELRQGLQFTDRASGKSPGQIQDALDQATEKSQRTSELLAGAKVVAERYYADKAIILSAIRERAQQELILAKRSGSYQGRSSADDVEAMMAKLAPDQYRDLASQEAQVKEMVKVLEALQENWTERTRNLRAMLSAAQR